MLTTIDEILASGRYTDRRGRSWRPNLGDNWVHFRGRKPSGEQSYGILPTDEMRLLVERDLHRDECPGLALCRTHPVPFVILWPMPTAIPAHTTIGRTCMNHERAFNEARLMAVAA